MHVCYLQAFDIQLFVMAKKIKKKLVQTLLCFSFHSVK